MSTGQGLVVGVLWVMALGLLGLVLLLYRQVDRAYSGAGRAGGGGLKPGVEIQPIEILTESGDVDVLELPTQEDRYLLAFVSLDCAGCRMLVRTLADRRAFDGPALAVIVDGVPKGKPVSDLPDGIPTYAAFGGSQLKRGFGVTVVPLLYVMRDRIVLASGTVTNEQELSRLLAEADSNEESLREVLADVESVTVTSSGRAHG
jgi:hypothetical protein